jgi:hypothetical protein
MGDEIEGAIQQAPHPIRQAGSSASDMTLESTWRKQRAQPRSDRQPVSATSVSEPPRDGRGLRGEALKRTIAADP